VTRTCPRTPVTSRLPESALSRLDVLLAARQPMMKSPAKAIIPHRELPSPGSNEAHEAQEPEERQGCHIRMSAQARKTKKMLMPTSSWKKSAS
jgi:hypothetical protein